MTMRVLLLYAHPVETSFNAALHDAILKGLNFAGHAVDDCDLYREDFDPRLTRAERLGYHQVGPNIETVRSYVERLRAAEALVLSFPVWNFGYPAILKGFFDRVFLPGVSFELKERGGITPKLQNVRKLAAVCTYGGTRVRAMMAGDPPRKAVKRVLRAQTGSIMTPCTYLARYDTDRASEEALRAFLARVTRKMAAF
jgi:putative NADPH-quinone reductase